MWQNLIRFLKRIDGKLTQGATEHGLELSTGLGNKARKNRSMSNAWLIRRCR